MERRIALVREFALTTLLLLALSKTVAQAAQAEPTSEVGSPSAETMLSLSQFADKAHQTGDINAEIKYRKDLSQLAWDNFARNPKSPGRWDRWAIIDENDLPLAILLEGTHQWSEAETVYRHNQSNLAHERLAGNDIKSENELHLAHLLAKEGKQSEASAICSHWKDRVKHNADFALSAVKYNVPTPPLYDTPEVEVGEWKLACGLPEEGHSLLSQQIQAHPGMLAPFTVLSRYYLAEGGFQKALETEKEGTTALLHR